jgi:hypothetical protein
MHTYTRPCFHAQVPYLDVYKELEGPHGPDRYKAYLSDGLHLTASGNLCVYNALIKLVEAHFPYLEAATMEMQGPSWDHLTPHTRSIKLYAHSA